MNGLPPHDTLEIMGRWFPEKQKEDEMNLNNLRYGRVTNLEAGIVNNVDATLILMASGMTNAGEIRKALREWRAEPTFGRHHFAYLFSKHHSTRLEGARRLSWGENETTAYWRTVTPGSYERGTYVLTPGGWGRLAQIHLD